MMVSSKTHQEYATCFIHSSTTFELNSTLVGRLFNSKSLRGKHGRSPIHNLNNSEYSGWFAPFGILGGLAYYLWRNQQKQFISSKEKIEQAESRIEREPEKAKPAWDLARATLEAYFNRNLSQVSWIFWLSVTVMFIGFVIVGFGIAQAMRSPNTLAPATIASLAGIITEFIGATFLFIYRSTIQQAIDYSQTLERINSVGMAMQILDTMPDQTNPEDLKSKTKANLVELLVRQSYDLSKTSRTTLASKNEPANNK